MWNSCEKIEFPHRWRREEGKRCIISSRLFSFPILYVIKSLYKRALYANKMKVATHGLIFLSGVQTISQGSPGISFNVQKNWLQNCKKRLWFGLKCIKMTLILESIRIKLKMQNILKLCFLVFNDVLELAYNCTCIWNLQKIEKHCFQNKHHFKNNYST